MNSKEEFKPSDFVKDVETEDGAVLLDVKQSLCFSLNPLGSRIWRMLKQRQSLDQIVGSLATEFNMSPNEIRPDVVEFSDDLRKHQILLPIESGDSRLSGLLHNVIRRAKSIKFRR